MRILNNLMVSKSLKKEDPQGFLASILLQKVKKVEGGPFGDKKSEKSNKAEKTGNSHKTNKS